VKYYEPEYAEGYERLRDAGKSAWGELHGEDGFEASKIRAVLAEARPHLRLPPGRLRALEYGCGTGPGACLLAEWGMEVDGVDLSPIAIDIAKREARRRGYDVRYQVGDVCTRAAEGAQYDLVVDSYCLQGIVTDADRAHLFGFVRGALKPGGCYLIATAGYDRRRDYGDSLFDRATGIELELLRGSPGEFTDAVCVGGSWYLPSRRHVTLEALVAELRAAGFDAGWRRVAPDGHIALVARARQ
jgi:SAM-dependent methyltransferase